MGFLFSTLITALSLCLGAVGIIEVGYRIGKREIAKSPDTEGLAVVDSSVFGILGLILAFTFTGALSRFDNRHELIVKEANAIGTAYLRLDLLDQSTQDKLRPLYRQYVQTRIDIYKYYENEKLLTDNYTKSLALQNQIWQIANSSVLREKILGSSL